MQARARRFAATDSALRSWQHDDVPDAGSAILQPGNSQISEPARVSNDNAFVESLFKTLKYRQLYPKRFYSLDEAQKYMREFFSWYNTEHYHSGVCHLTPMQCTADWRHRF
ncbi:MAG: transposase [Candidatus Obscuribacter sp.]|nr:transposase [Candidatus Obscuribacter sp.]